ncbi:hypothetical protein PanWU01x14_172410 [Parasponia andersonii]|uniref:Uncharacterized protein n=1 Tax=Parasponia andersonii TaxID=3476 RepID=A0A2P5C9J5_PARAD|nr:hypothetical protein PanWU01x14_172410 [Parasponia andersonii]
MYFFLMTGNFLCLPHLHPRLCTWRDRRQREASTFTKFANGLETAFDPFSPPSVPEFKGESI